VQHPLLLTCATTQEVLAVRNRPGAAVSSAGTRDMLVENLARVVAGLGQAVVRMDAGLETAAIRRACLKNGACFVRAEAGRHERYRLLEHLPDEAWVEWLPSMERSRDGAPACEPKRPRRRGRNLRLETMLRRYKDDKSKGRHWLAEVECRPTKSKPACRLIVIREDLRRRCAEKQPPLFLHSDHRFVLTNLPATYTPSDVIDLSHDRCDQEKIICQLGDDVPMWRIPVREFAGHEAFLEITRLTLEHEQVAGAAARVHPVGMEALPVGVRLHRGGGHPARAPDLATFPSRAALRRNAASRAREARSIGRRQWPARAPASG